jgi:CTP:molybdopterin cytidylyltransferase MocA
MLRHATHSQQAYTGCLKSFENGMRAVPRTGCLKSFENGMRAVPKKKKKS